MEVFFFLLSISFLFKNNKIKTLSFSHKMLTYYTLSCIFNYNSLQPISSNLIHKSHSRRKPKRGLKQSDSAPSAAPSNPNAHITAESAAVVSSEWTTTALVWNTERPFCRNHAQRLRGSLNILSCLCSCAADNIFLVSTFCCKYTEVHDSFLLITTFLISNFLNYFHFK